MEGRMWIFLLGWVSLVFGALLIFNPHHLIRLSQGLNRMIAKVDETVLKYRVGVGICLIGGGFFFFFAYYMLLNR
jgi:uncharacterized membrane protein HdeD (DUF308 family)